MLEGVDGAWFLGIEPRPAGSERCRQMERGSCARRERSHDNRVFIVETRHCQLGYRHLCGAPDRPVFLALARYSS